MTSIKVAVRCRPLFAEERPAIGLDLQGRRILLDAKTYDPDYTFPASASQDDVYAVCRPIIQCVKDGLNGTVMVYGQTGTGKTYTMLGVDGEDNGIVHKVIAELLEHVRQKTADGAQCALVLSMLEIYNEKLTDMLSPNGDEEVSLIGGYPRFTRKVTLGDVQDAKAAVAAGLAWRHTATTLMNERSSRSHVVFILDLEELNAFTEQTDVAHLFLVDLAGSESLKKSQATGATAGETGKINKSLLALKSVFLALSNTNEATRPAHVPYRDSKLTELLQDSIGGSARTLLIACVSSVGRDIEETKSTLLYAVKARSIRNAANTEKEKLLVRLRSIEVENQRLRNRLQERVNERGGYYVTKDEHEALQALEEECRTLRDQVDQLGKVQECNEVHRHIAKSQAAQYQSLLARKDDELQEFKHRYEAALRGFERQALLLQHTVEAATAEARQSIDRVMQQKETALTEWHTRVLKMIEDGDNDGVECETRVEEEGRRELPLEQENGEDTTQSAALSPVQQPSTTTTTQSNGNVSTKAREGETGGCALVRGSPGRRPHTARSSPAPHLPRPSADSRAGSSTTSNIVVMPPALTLPAASEKHGVSPARRPHRLASRDTKNNTTSARSTMNNNSNVARMLKLTMDETEGQSQGSVTTCPVKEEGTSDDTADKENNNTTTTQCVTAATTTPATTTILAEADRDCARVGRRINDAFTALIMQLALTCQEYSAAMQAVQSQRAQATQAVATELRAALEAGLQRLTREDERVDAELHRAEAAMRGRLRIAQQQPLPAAAAPLRQITRGACHGLLRSLEPLLHDNTNNDTKENAGVVVHDALDTIALRHRRQVNASCVDSLGLIASMSTTTTSVNFTTQGTSSGATPVSSPLLTSNNAHASHVNGGQSPCGYGNNVSGSTDTQASSPSQHTIAANVVASTTAATTSGRSPRPSAATRMTLGGALMMQSQHGRASLRNRASSNTSNNVISASKTLKRTRSARTTSSAEGGESARRSVFARLHAERRQGRE